MAAIEAREVAEHAATYKIVATVEEVFEINVFDV
jgi:hypothetical protein